MTLARNICVCIDFLTQVHKEHIRKAAEETGFTPYFFTLNELEEAKACVQDCEILYSHSPDLLRSAPATLQWYACCFAGVDPYCKDESIFANPACILTNANVYGVTISEHVVMVLLMLLRRMPDYAKIVAAREWTNKLPIQSIRGNTFTLLGTGNIGQTVAKRLRAMGAARIVGISRSGNPVTDDFDEVLPVSRLDEILPETYHLIMAMPGTAETAGILSRERIARMPQGACIVNVGRGSAVDQEALIEALNNGKLGGAALDVMMPEPLPADHPLWTAKNVIITPHVSGNMSLEYTCDAAVELFCEDLRRYAAGLPMENIVDRKLGY